jgi:hypothetical protein
MSWDSRTSRTSWSTSRAGGTALASCATVGDTDAALAGSPGFPSPTKEQVDALMAGFNGPDKLHSTGIQLGDQNFQFSPDGRAVMWGRRGGSGCCIKRAATLLVIGLCDEPVEAGAATERVETFGNLFNDLGQ